MGEWLKSTIDYWIGPLAIIVLLVGGAILLKLVRLWTSMREPYRSILIFMIVIAAGLAWNYFASPEEKRKVMQGLCKPDPLFGLRHWDCP